MDNPNEAVRRYEQGVDRDFRRNVIAFVGWETLWGLGMPFAMFATFAPAYLNALQAPKWLIGLVLAFPSIFSACQIVVSYWLPAQRRLEIYRKTYVLCIVPWPVYAALAFFFGAGWPNVLHIAIFVAIQALFVGTAYAGQSTGGEIQMDNIPPRRRGFVFGFRSAGLGIAGIGMGLLATRVLAHWEPPRNYQLSFVIGTSLYLVSCLMLWQIRDHVNPEHSAKEEGPRPSFASYLWNLLNQLRGDPNYRIFIFFTTLLAIAIGGAPIMMAAAQETLGAPASATGVFSLIYLGSAGAFGWVLGWLADRFGYRLVGGVCGALLTGAYLLCLVSRQLVFWYIAYAGYAVTNMALALLVCNMSAELCPAIPPSRLVALGNLVMVAFVPIATTLGGGIVDVTGSYEPFFIANLVLCVVAVLGFAFIVREPRSGKLYMIKTLPRG